MKNCVDERITEKETEVSNKGETKWDEEKEVEVEDGVKKMGK